MAGRLLQLGNQLTKCLREDLFKGLQRRVVLYDRQLIPSPEMGDTGVYLRSPWRAIRCRARARSWMALDRIGDVEQILKISIAWMGELPQRAPDQHSRRTGKPPPLLPAFVPGRLSD